jgi:hypothetical protein
MQDHYLKLGLDPAATSAEILQAIEAKPELSAAAEILLNDHRRAAYQRTVFTLRSIGILRHRLGLDNDHSWFVETCPDFAPRLHSRKFAPQVPAAADAAAAAPADAATSAAGGANTTQTSSASATPVTPTAGEKAMQNRPWLKPVIILLAVVAILVLLSVVL